MKLKLDVVNKWQEPPEEVETVKFWVIPNDCIIQIGATMPSGNNVTIGFFELDEDGKGIQLALMSDLSSKYFKKNVHTDHIYTY